MNGTIPMMGTDPLIVRIAEEHGKKKAEFNVGYYPPSGPSNFQGMGLSIYIIIQTCFQIRCIGFTSVFDICAIISFIQTYDLYELFI